jgi:hypothetical protein
MFSTSATLMPLRDHFHPPLSTRRYWHSFHQAWATYLASDLNAQTTRPNQELKCVTVCRLVASSEEQSGAG